MLRLQTTFAGLSLRNPLVIGSSGLTNTVDKNILLEKAGAGAIVLKSLFEEQMELAVNTLPDTDYPDAAGYIEQYVRSHELQAHLDLIKKTKKACSIPIIASINCYKRDSWIDFAQQIEESGADALELNIFRLFTDITGSQNDLESLYIEVLQSLRKKISIPIIVKCAKYFSNIPLLANKLSVCGANGIVFFNRFYQPDIDIHSLQATSGDIFSTSSDLGDTLRWCSIVSSKLPKTDLAASSGVNSWEDILKCILSGASAVYLCSALYKNGNGFISNALNKITDWMDNNSVKSINDYKGRLNYTDVTDQSVFERTQFMRYYSSRE
ncbi:MAG: dihydroorotate dehydrogenase-like protein [Bacteroidales bacterium]|nr:dihydroorotate dehydrogenase-like protein [Bacteroidales bacterium]